jgi:PAS domain S-box-containing protein
MAVAQQKNTRVGWAGLFKTAFRQSRNPMALVDERRRNLDVNGAFVKLLGYPRSEILGAPTWRFVAGGPLLSDVEWAGVLRSAPFTSELGLITADGTVVEVQSAITPEVVTGHNLALFVALSTSRWGRYFRRDIEDSATTEALSPRECEIVRMIAMGSTGPEIADQLHLSHYTVRTHVRNAMSKLGARSRAHLVARALGEGHVLV